MQISIAGLSAGCVLILGWRELRHIDEPGCNISEKFFQGHHFSAENLKELVLCHLSPARIVYNTLIALESSNATSLYE